MTGLAAIRARFARVPAGGVDPAGRFDVGPGSLRDYDALARFHYRAGRPATAVRVLCARDPCGGAIAGVLVVSMPTLDGLWRRLAWPGRYEPRPGRERRAAQREAAARINAELRTISRVVIDPRFRGLGLACRLVRGYLDAPLTPATEAIAAMGAVCPFFAAAGMTEHRPPPPPWNVRLARALRAAGVGPASLLDPRLAPRLARDPRIERELRRWARASRAAKPLRSADAREIARAAAFALAAPIVAYTHTTSSRTGPERRAPTFEP